MNCIIDNDGLHGSKDVSTKTILKAGKYSIKILYFEGNGDQSLKLEYEGPDISRRIVPASMFLIK